MKRIFLLILSAFFLSSAPVRSQVLTQSGLKALGAPNEPKVEIAWNRFYDHKGITEICQKIAAAHPGLCKLESIGKSFLGKDLWVLKVTNFKNGVELEKPGFYIDGNIHANEIQGAEVALYTAWYLCEMFGKLDFITALLDQKIFYIVPSINPDGRDHYMASPNNRHSPRSGLMPVDDDGDGLLDEDQYDDLDGDGNIVQMRRANTAGRWKAHPDYPGLMVPCKPDEPGQYELLGFEGFDNDDDGEVNEDAPGYYDPNRDWPWNWQAKYLQFGARPYPTYLPETQSVVAFSLAHPNIAGAQSYHNSGGMILRGPGAENDKFEADDLVVYDAIGKKGEEILPNYDYLIVYKDLYSVYGGELDWFYGGLGIITFSNELWTSYNMFRKAYDGAAFNWQVALTDLHKFDEYLLFGEAIVDWKPVTHPQYGAIEIGGIKKNTSRVPPSFLLEEECHRNMAFTLYHADQMPLIEIKEVSVRDLPGGLKEIKAEIHNTRLVPTRSAQDVKNNINRADRISLDGKQIEVLAGGVLDDPLLDISKDQKFQPQTLKVNSIPGMGSMTVKWIVKGKGDYTIVADALKGGKTRFQGKL